MAEPTAFVPARWPVADVQARSALLAWSAIPFVTAFGVAVQRHLFSHPDRDVAFLALALVPTVLDLTSLRWPRVCPPRLLASVIVTVAVFGLVLDPVRNDLAPFLLVISTGETAAGAPALQSVIALVLADAMMLGVQAAGRFDGSFTWVLGISMGWGAGMVLRYIMSLLEGLKAAQSDLAARAAADERQRIAREVHDVVAHTLAVTMLHVTGARMALRRDPEEAAAALERAEQLGRQSLAEVRQLVGLLQPASAGTAPPQPGANDVPQLVAEFREAGLDVDFAVDGDLSRCAPSSGLALYRIAQESLTNVTKHAPGTPARVRVSVDDHDVALVVENGMDASSSVRGANGSGMGITGMRDRAAALGGRVHVERDGSWRVEARLPTVPA